MRIFIICPVRFANDEIREKLENYTAELELQGHKVHLPHRDTDQTQSGFNICRQNKEAICSSDIVHVLYLEESRGTHFDLGVAFAYNKPIKIVEFIKCSEGNPWKSMLLDWESDN